MRPLVTAKASAVRLFGPDSPQATEADRKLRAAKLAKAIRVIGLDVLPAATVIAETVREPVST